MTENRNILVTGATGKQGGAVARELLARGYSIRAMTRKPEGEAAQALAGLGAEIVRGDLDDAASLARAVEGVWGVFALQNTWEAGVQREEEQGKRLARIAKDAGVQAILGCEIEVGGRRFVFIAKDRGGERRAEGAEGTPVEEIDAAGAAGPG